MYKCNKCGAFFERPEEKEIESENHARPFGDGSEPFGGGYYSCCPECVCEDFDRYDEEEYIADLENELEITKKALELAVADKCCLENCIAEQVVGKGAAVAVPKKEQWYLEKAKEMVKSENL